MLKMPQMPATPMLPENRTLEWKRGKELETIILGESSLKSTGVETNDDIIRLNRSTARQLKGFIDLMQPNDFEKPTSGFSLTKEKLWEYVENGNWAENPAKLKLFMSKHESVRDEKKKRLAEVLAGERRGVKYSLTENSVALKRELEVLNKKLSVLNSFKNTIKDSEGFFERSDKPGMIGKICDMMSKIQEAEPVRKPFSNTLITSLREILSGKGIEVNKLQFVTTLVSGGDKVMTWPDFFGVDAFLNYDLVINGVQKKGRILFDGTADIEKSKGKIGGESVSNGMGGFTRDKFFIPFDCLKTEEDIPSLAIDVARYIAEKTIPNLT